MKGTHMPDREQSPKHTAKTPSHRTGIFATLRALLRGQGTSAPSSRHVRAALAALALAIAAFAATAAPASADTVEMDTVSNVSYTSADVTGKVSVTDPPFFAIYSYEYSTNETDWNLGPGGFLGVGANQSVPAELTELKGGTTYFVRLKAGAITSPASSPYPEFTTLTADPTSVVQVDNASGVAYTTATAKGEIDRPAKSNNVACHFEYITDAQFTTNQGNSLPGFQGATPVGCEPQSSVEATGHVPVEAKLTGLANDTEYHLRLAVSNASSEDAKEAAPFKTLKVDPPSVVSVENASEVEYTQAQVKGVVERPDTVPDPGVDVTCNFEYITDDQYKANELALAPLFEGATPVLCEPEAEPAENPITATGPTPVKAALGGLVPQTTYHLRLSASNQGGFDAKEAATTFTTQGPAPAPSVLTIDDASDIHVNSAKVSGSVERPAGADPGLDLNCNFEYISDAQFKENEEVNLQPGFSGAAQAPCETGNPAETPGTVKATGNVPVSATIGVSAGTTYHLRLSAQNVGGTDTKEASNFTSRIPVLTLDPPTVGYTSAEVSGTVNPEGGNANNVLEGHFQYSTEPGNPDSWVDSNLGFGFAPATGDTPIPVGGTINGLQPGTTYAFRFFATNLIEFTVYPPQPYPEATTKPVATPTATLDVTDITANTAHFSGTVSANAPGPLDPEGETAYETAWQIECTPACPRLLPAGSGVVKGPDGAKAISVDATELEANKSYEVKLVASNAGGTSEPLQPFSTPLVKPTIRQFEGASDGEGGYTLQGTVNPNNSKVTDCKFVWGPESHPDPDEYAFEADCSPMPVGRDEMQKVNLLGPQNQNNPGLFGPVTEGQFKLTFGGQTTGDIPFNATAADVEAALEALSTIGSGNVAVAAGPGQSYTVIFEGSLAGTDVRQIQGESGTTPLGGVDPLTQAPGPGTVQTAVVAQGGNSKAVTVEAHLTGLNIGSHYHALLVATNAAGESEGVDQEFVPTRNPPEDCPNQQLRKENNSLALPECRAYEQVSPQNKNSGDASLGAFTGDGSTVAFSSATNFGNSGNADPYYASAYTTQRSETGWAMRTDLNGPLKSVYAGPDGFSATPQIMFTTPDLLSSLWGGTMKSDPAAGVENPQDLYLRRPDGTFVLIGKAPPTSAGEVVKTQLVANDDLSHVFVTGTGKNDNVIWGPGVYEFVGTGNGGTPRRVDVDNTGAPISSCLVDHWFSFSGSAYDYAISADGRALVFKTFGGCGGSNPSANELWVRVDGTTSFDVSASQCSRTAADPGGACYVPPCPVVRGSCDPRSGPQFESATPDGSRLFFTTTEQLLNADTDQANDIYACDLPTTPQAPVGKANPCPTLTQVSSGAEVDRVLAASKDGSAVYFMAKSVLADNEDALGNAAVAGDRNIYVWRQNEADPLGQISFVARFSDDGPDSAAEARFQTTSEGRYLVFSPRGSLLPGDTDNARDVYRYDAEDEALTRVSFGTSGASGNADGFDASIRVGGNSVSNDGKTIAFTTSEPLSPLDGNGDPDVYLWSHGRVFRITAGAKGSTGFAGVSASGADVFFTTGEQLIPSDRDQGNDVYDARVEGGFSQAELRSCSGEACQSPSPVLPPSPPSPANRPNGEGNVKPTRPCPKGKVRKHGKCVKKSKKHKQAKGKKGSHKRTGHNRGGSK